MLPIMQNAGSAIQAATRGLVGTDRTIAQAQTGIDETRRPVNQPQADQGSNPDSNQNASSRPAYENEARGRMLDMVVGQTAVDMAEAKAAVKANVAVIKTTDEMIGSLLDVMA